MSVIIFGFFYSFDRLYSHFFLGRNREYQDLNLGFVFNVAISATIISWFPKPLKRYVVPPLSVSLSIKPHFSIVSRTLSNLPSKIQQEIDFIRPMVEERFAKMEEYGKDWDDKPVCRTIALISPLLQLRGRFTERSAHVAHD
jgi:hypothetical protein